MPKAPLHVLLLCSAALAASSGCASPRRPGPVPEHVASVPEPRPEERWMERHELINSRIAAEPPDLIFVGDSITQGWEGNGKEVWEEFYGSRKAANLGIGGDRTQHVLWRLQHGNLDGISPRVAVVMIGTNNSGDDSPQQIADGITAIVSCLRERLPQTRILLLGVFPRGADDDDARRKVNRQVNERIAVLDDGEWTEVLDIGEAFLLPDGTLLEEIMPDRLHLSPEGYRIWAGAIEPSLRRLLGE